jgi:hypothetical protein
MKTIKNKLGELKRVNDREAEKLVRQKNLGWNFCAKSEFKNLKNYRK